MSTGRFNESTLERVYVSVKDGKFEFKAKSLDPKKPWIVERETKDGKKFILETCDWIEGFITKVVYVPDSKIGKRVNIHLTSDKLYIIDLPHVSQKGWMSPYAAHFLVRFGNINLDEQVRFVPYDFVSKGDGKRHVGMSISQNGEKVERGIPFDEVPAAAEKKAFDGTKTYDPTEQTAFYHELLLNVASTVDKYMSGKDFASKEAFPGLNGGEEDFESLPVEEDVPNFEDDSDDDLPF